LEKSHLSTCFRSTPIPKMLEPKCLLRLSRFLLGRDESVRFPDIALPKAHNTVILHLKTVFYTIGRSQKYFNPPGEKVWASRTTRRNLP